jgi:hypothetical protein
MKDPTPIHPEESYDPLGSGLENPPQYASEMLGREDNYGTFGQHIDSASADTGK